MSGKPAKFDEASKILNPQHRSIFDLAKPLLQTRHNEIHTLGSYGYALYLLSVEGGDPAVVIPAILLHDIGWSAVPEDQQLMAFGPVVTKPELQRKHEVEGARLARILLGEIQYPEDLICKIERIIDGHDTRMEAADINDMLVQDSDKLFRLSRTGFQIDCIRFRLAPRRHLRWLFNIAKSWFFTRSAYGLALDELEERQNELDGDL